jgi:hypothetical protein
MSGRDARAPHEAPTFHLPLPFIFLSPLGERLGEGVMQETIFALTPSPNLSPRGERKMKEDERRSSALRNPIPPSYQP